MVQDANQPREHFPPSRAPYWAPQDRFPIESVPEERSFPDSQDIRRPPMAIDKALREYCNISAEFYVVIPVIEGKPHIFTAPNIPGINISQFLDVKALSRELQRVQSATNPAYTEPEFGFEPDINRYPMDPSRRWTQERRYGQPMSLASFEDDGNYKARKRPRASMVRREPENYDDEPTAASVPSKRGLTIRDDKAVWSFYEERFKTIQQSACKLIAKAWVKAVEPKKQSTHPYTGADEKAPDWWPKPWGPNKEHRVRHKEPDHLYKRGKAASDRRENENIGYTDQDLLERVHLLNHILRMVVEPNHNQHPSIQKLYLNVSKLEEVTNEALSSFFTDKDNPSNLAKRPYLKEIFKVAHLEERYKDGQVDGSTVIYVMPNDRVSQGYVSDTEDVTPGRDEGEHNPTPNSSSSSPQRANMPHTLMAQPHSTEQSPTTQISNDTFVGEMPVRGTQYSQPVMSTEIGPDRQTFVEAPSMPSQAPLHPSTNLGLHDMYTSPHDSSRRSSMFTTPSEYTSPATPTMYQQWQTGSAAPSTPSAYTFPQQTSNTHQSFVSHTGVPMAQNQQYMNTTSFDGLSRGSHDAQHGGMIRSLPQPTFTNYIPHESGPIPGSGTKGDTLPRHPTQ
ncbi:hypothetical protein F5Y11DRAFT_364433 [Daldinia sp. FL1419]|nr:hypothetical protein F5Y11DRAFT_364433 [Daldinia sp. FL1419]